MCFLNVAVQTTTASIWRKNFKKNPSKVTSRQKKGDATLSVLQKPKNGIKNLREAEIIRSDD